MKKILILSLLLPGFVALNACPVCEAQQPRVLQGITHGSGPQSNWDYLIIGVTAVIVLATLFFSLKYLLSPGEENKKHIKRLVLNYE
jgi:uncharacterized protein HemY